MFKTLDDYKDKKNDNEDKKPDKKKTDSYAGGGKSGLAVENPANVDEILSKAESSQKGLSETNCKITLFKNGFSVDGGPFRDYNLPENQDFMKELNKGNVPKELRKKYPNGLNVGLEDKRAEVWRPPTPPKYIAFSGKGVSMEGGAKIDATGMIDLNAEKPPVDESKPKTTVQIRLHNGQKIILVINLDAMVVTIFDYVLR